MFERTFEEMAGSFFIEKNNYSHLIGMGLGNLNLKIGFNSVTSLEALELIKEFDNALLSCPKYLYKRVLATRNSIMFAFGPEMEERIK